MPKNEARTFEENLPRYQKLAETDVTMESLLLRRKEMLLFQERGEDRKELERNEAEIVEYYNSSRNNG